MLPIIVSLIIATSLYFVARRKSSPEWLKGSEENFKKWNYASLSFSILIGCSLAVMTFNIDAPEFWKILISGASTALSFVFITSIWTDHKFMKVDRVLLRVSLLITLSLGIPQIVSLNNEIYTVVYIISIALSFAIFFTPVGASDARAYMLFFSASWPALGLIFTYYAFVLGVGLILLYGLIYFIRKSRIARIPLIPYILAPYIVFIYYSTIILM